jgi:hypothetical protein
MQILGLADSTPKPQNRAKSLFWPSIQNETDVDYVTRQGFWICSIVAVFALVVGGFQGPAVFTIELFEGVFFFLSGVGSRMRSPFAAISAFVVYFLSTFIVGFGIGRVIFAALLLANARGTWLSSRWRASQTEPPPLPLSETILDKFSDRLPIAIWPAGRYLYYVLAALEFGLIITAISGSSGPLK